MDTTLSDSTLAEPTTMTGSRCTQSLSRRGFLVRGLASGFALGVGPVMADTIKTDATGLIAGAVDIPVADGRIPGYRAKPSTGSHFPVVVVVEEIFGVHEHIQDLCRRFAKLGYYAIAPELFSRQGDVTRMTDVQSIMRDVIAHTPDADLMSDLDATVAFAAHEKANTLRTGIIGYCWGGRVVWLYAAHNPTLKAGISYYGVLTGMQSSLTPKDPIDLADQITVPVLGFYAGLDTYITTSSINQMNEHLKAGTSGSELLVFPNVNHGFNADYRASYDPTAARYAWTLATSWLKDHGV